jgi:hypothetical protein
MDDARSGGVQRAVVSFEGVYGWNSPCGLFLNGLNGLNGLNECLN